jgi:hypothetical protein
MTMLNRSSSCSRDSLHCLSASESPHSLSLIVRSSESGCDSGSESISSWEPEADNSTSEGSEEEILSDIFEGSARELDCLVEEGYDVAQ